MYSNQDNIPRMNTLSSLKNHLLIAMPALEDENFSKTVTYICEHTEEGAMGLILSVPIDIAFKEVVEQVDKDISDDTLVDNIDEIPVYLGGPVEPEHGFVLHTPQGEWKSSMVLSEQLILTTSSDIISAIAIGEGPEHYIVALGYAGWGAGQLEQEILENSWLSVPADMNQLWEAQPAERWSKAAQLLGIDLRSLSNDIGHA